jgi:hypothetical protein
MGNMKVVTPEKGHIIRNATCVQIICQRYTKGDVLKHITSFVIGISQLISH